MNFKLSHIAAVLVASASFSTLAVNDIDNLKLTKPFSFAVSADDSVKLVISPINDLTEANIVNGNQTALARFEVKGLNAALRVLTNVQKDAYCGISKGVSTGAAIEMCIRGFSAAPYLINGGSYYPVPQGNLSLGIGSDTNKSQVKADVYPFKLELVKYAI